MFTCAGTHCDLRTSPYQPVKERRRRHGRGEQRGAGLLSDGGAAPHAAVGTHHLLRGPPGREARDRLRPPSGQRRQSQESSEGQASLNAPLCFETFFMVIN